MENVEKPLLTLVVNCYKFERFVEEALDGAFAQTYRPLEIVISDDHSPDGTWDKVQAKVKEFLAKHPEVPCRDLSNEMFPQTISAPEAPLSIVLNRNGMNLGLARHQNRLFELSHGEWVAFQSGDDVSVPDRMEKIAERVMENPRIRCLHSGVKIVDGAGIDIEVSRSFERQRHRKGDGLPAILGAGAVYHRDVYSLFGPLGPFVKNEDHVLPLRASLIGDIEYIEDALVKYCKHGDNLSGSFSTNPELAIYKRFEALDALYPCLDDINRAELDGLASLPKLMTLRRRVNEEIFLQWFVGHWQKRVLSRMKLLALLFSKPSHILYFISRCIDKFA